MCKEIWSSLFLGGRLRWRNESWKVLDVQFLLNHYLPLANWNFNVLLRKQWYRFPKRPYNEWSHLKCLDALDHLTIPVHVPHWSLNNLSRIPDKYKSNNLGTHSPRPNHLLETLCPWTLTVLWISLIKPKISLLPRRERTKMEDETTQRN